jgi:class 3 adenylate cyclase/tetratricopeptide (TPR) repeat protein
MHCTTPLTGSPARATRRTVTIVFSDLVGSTALGELLDPEALREVLDRYFREMSDRLQRHGGTVEKYIGDAIMAVFGLPRAHEDDAIRACLAATSMRERLVVLNAELFTRWGTTLTNRTGIYTGEVVTGDPATGLRLVTGDAVNTAARLEQAAPAGEILVGESTYALAAHAVEVEAVEPVTAKGKSEPLDAFRLISAQPLQAVARRPVGPMIGRYAEFEALLDAFDRAARERRSVIVTVVGEAGVGKTRLVAEVADAVRERGRILSGRCLPYGEGLTYWALAEIVREAAGIGLDDEHDLALERLAELVAAAPDSAMLTARLATALGLAVTPFAREELHWAFRRVAEHLCGDRPLMMVIDDVQWADDALLEALAHIGTFATDVPLLVVSLSRPEQPERSKRPADPEGSLTIHLEPLLPADVAALVRQILGIRPGADVVDAIGRAAQGNPLFVEQLLAMWRDQGLVHPAGQERTAELSGEDLPVPASLRALLSARLDVLPGGERMLLERGSVIGQVFDEGAVQVLAPPDALGSLDSTYRALHAKRLIRPDVSAFTDDHAWAFVHILVRDATYEGMLKRDRSDLHERFARWLRRRAGERLAEFEEIIGHHLERAFRLREGLGPLDDAARTLAVDATEAFVSSGERALARLDILAASRLFKRAAFLAPVGSPERFRLSVRAMDAAMVVGDLPRAEALSHDLEDTEAPDAMADARRRSVSIYIRASRSTAPLVDLLEELDPVEDVLRSSNDTEALAYAQRRRASLLGWLGREAQSRAVSADVEQLARAIGRVDLEIDAMTNGMMGALFDGSDVADAVRRCEDALQAHAGDRSFTMALSRPLAIMWGMQKRSDDARRLLGDLAQMHEELGMTPSARRVLAEAAALVEDSAADPAALEEALRPGYELMVALGEKASRCSFAALLAHALAELGRVGDAVALAEESRGLAQDDDYDAQTRWRMARGLTLMALDRHADAEELLREAVGIVSQTEDINLEAAALLDLAVVVRARDRTEDAYVIARRAADLFARKGNLAGVERVRRSFGLEK